MPSPLVKCHTSLGKTRTHTRQVFEELASVFEIYFAWGNGPTGDHAAGKALDMMSYADGTVDRPGQIRPGWNAKVAAYGLKHRERLGIRYIISDQTIWSSSPRSVTGVDPWKPKRYSGQSHANHNHWSFLENPPAYRPLTTPAPPAQTTPKDDAMPTPEDLWKHKLSPGPTADAIGGYPKDASYPAADLLIGVEARVRRLEATVANQYNALLANVQQEDPRWADLSIQLAAESAARVAFEDRVVAGLQGLYAKLDALIQATPVEPPAPKFPTPDQS